MPSQKPRIALTVPEDLDSVLDRLSSLTGTPKTKLIIEILEEYRPIFERAVEALELIQSDKSNAQNIAKAFVGEMLLEGSEKLGSLAAEIKKG
jgi:predicted DNA-binding protein